MLYLVEHFYSIQGEGKYTGVPSLFFRFGGCNMQCVGFGCSEEAPDGQVVVGCDTVYAVNKKHFASRWSELYRSDDLIRILRSYDLPKNVDVVLTGGEPLIYANNTIFIEFITFLVDHGYRVTFETNGAMAIDFEKYPVFKECVYALSIKLSNSNEPKEKRVRPEVFGTIAKHAKESFFKFTVDKAHIGSDLEKEIDEICSYEPQTEVYCMPMGGSKEEIELNCEPVIELCKKRGFVYSDRLHIRIWDQNKGV